MNGGKTFAPFYQPERLIFDLNIGLSGKAALKFCSENVGTIKNNERIKS